MHVFLFLKNEISAKFQLLENMDIERFCNLSTLWMHALGRRIFTVNDYHWISNDYRFLLSFGPRLLERRFHCPLTLIIPSRVRVKRNLWIDFHLHTSLKNLPVGVQRCFATALDGLHSFCYHFPLWIWLIAFWQKMDFVVLKDNIFQIVVL